MKREKKLISGNSSQAITGMEREIIHGVCLKRVAVFFENANFLITKYQPLSNAVCLILEMQDGTEFHIEGGNCGYGGMGPHATLAILEMCGISGAYVDELIFNYQAVQFEVKGKAILKNTVDTSYLFYNAIPGYEEDRQFLNKIEKGRSIDVSLEQRKVVIYNPHRTCWNGMLNLLSYMENIEFEYYIGTNSPLEDGIWMDKDLKRKISAMGMVDLKGVKHVNLTMAGTNFSIVCWIDREDERAVIEAVYLSLTGKALFESQKTGNSFWKCCKQIIKLWKERDKEQHERINVQKKNLRGGRRWIE